MYYKVVREDLTSLSDYAEWFDAKVQYKIGRWMKPKHENAPLFVYSQKPDMSTMGRGSRLFECAVIESMREWYPVCNLKGFTRNIETSKAGLKTFAHHFAVPHSTVYADQVMLTKEILPEEVKPKVYYKVLDCYMTSVSAESKAADLAVAYQRDFWITPKNPLFPLMVFNSYAEAKSFASYRHNIYKCEIVPSKQKWGYVPSREIKRVKQLKMKKKKFLDQLNLGHSCPPGTVFADAVKIID